MKKEKLLINGQIEHMKNESDILFNIVDEETAREFLRNNNYYFKIKSYAKNYEKYIEGENVDKYINLEFAYLVEMSKIDMYFRRFIIRMTLDIEHFLKTQLLRDFTENEYEDGYNIVNELFSKYPYIEENINKKATNSACSDLVLKCKGKFAIWNLVEVLSFGDFTKLYNLYYEKSLALHKMKKYLSSIKLVSRTDKTC